MGLLTLLKKITKSVLAPRGDSRWDMAAMPTTISADRVWSAIRQAENGDTRLLFKLYEETILRDTHVQSGLATRKLAVLGDPMRVSPPDLDETPEGKAASDAVRILLRQIKGCPQGSHTSWLDTMVHLLDGALYPVSVAEKWFVYQDGQWVPRLKIVRHELLDFSQGRLRIRMTDAADQPLESFMELDDEDRWIVHRGHLLTSIRDNRGGPMRSILFWWLYKNATVDFWARFMERFGAPFLVGKYDGQNEDAKRSLHRAFAQTTQMFSVVTSRETEVQLLQAATSQTGEAYKELVETANREISKMLLGQTLTSDAQPTGLGSSQASVHNGIRSDYRDWDAGRLGATIAEQLFPQIMTYNGLRGPCPTLFWGLEDSGSVAETNETLRVLGPAGLEIEDSALPIISRRVGFQVRRAAATPSPEPGEDTATLAAIPGLPKAIRGASTLRDVLDAVRAVPPVGRRATALAQDMAGEIAAPTLS